jgi:hypothetical protein
LNPRFCGIRTTKIGIRMQVKISIKHVSVNE